MFGVPYALGLSVAGGDDFQNQTGWLAVPVIGPWVTLAARDRCDASVTYDDTFDTFESTCDEERTIRTLLVMDALMQVTGATLLVWGLTSKTKRYVRDDVSLQVLPTHVGRSGYGLGAVGTF